MDFNISYTNIKNLTLSYKYFFNYLCKNYNNVYICSYLCYTSPDAD